MSDRGFSSARLARLREAMTGYVERGDLPGVVTAVARGAELHVDAVGEVRRDTLFRISSMTKPITAVAAMILVEECKLRLDEPVDRLLPELADRRVLNRPNGPLDDTRPAKRPIAVRDLLTFTFGSGLLFDFSAPIVKRAEELALGNGPPSPRVPPEPDEWIRRLGTLPLMHDPGERWMYNLGSDVLSVLVARASGKPFDVFLRERIFEPLSMKDTSFHVEASRRDRFGTSLWRDFRTGTVEVYDPVDGQWSTPPAFPSGAAGLVSTIDDYLAFSRMLLGDGKVGSTRILSRASVALMTHDHLTPAQKAVSGLFPGAFDAMGWGFGVSIVTRRHDVFGVGTFGWDGGMGTSWRADPNEGLTGLLMTSRMWDSASPPNVVRDFWTCAYAALDD